MDTGGKTIITITETVEENVDDLVVQNIMITDIVAESSDNQQELPPASFVNVTAVKLEEWFYSFCTKENPGNTPVAYRFALFETANLYALCLNRYINKEIDPGASEYYPLSKIEFKNLDWQQVLDKIKQRLKELVNSERFKNSPLAKAKTISFKFDDGEVINLK